MIQWRVFVQENSTERLISNTESSMSPFTPVCCSPTVSSLWFARVLSSSSQVIDTAQQIASRCLISNRPPLSGHMLPSSHVGMIVFTKWALHEHHHKVVITSGKILSDWRHQFMYHGAEANWYLLNSLHCEFWPCILVCIHYCEILQQQ